MASNRVKRHCIDCFQLLLLIQTSKGYLPELPERGNDMSLLQDKLAQSGDHHHSHGIIHMMIEGALIGGVAALLGHLVSNGMEEVVQKWQDGNHHPVDLNQLQAALGPDKLQQIAQSTGMSVNDTLQTLASHLPGAAKSHFGF